MKSDPKIILKGLSALVFFLSILLCGQTAWAKDPGQFKILAVMSYHPEYAGEIEIRQGIESILDIAEIKYFYLDAKKHPELSADKGKEAYKLFNTFKPHAVIAANDNAQSDFVVPYLKGTTATPVLFCGVNDDAARYGYPAANVTGILEKKHFRESISLAQLINPGIGKIAVLYKENLSNQTNLEQLQKERTSLPVEMTEIIRVTSIQDVMQALETLTGKVDGLLLLNLTGILSRKGQPMEGTEALAAIVEIWNKPTIAANSWEIESGALCGVVKVGQEQGAVAARMARDILHGKKIEQIPVTQNRNGRRVINLSTANRLGIKLKPMVLLGTELIR